MSISGEGPSRAPANSGQQVRVLSPSRRELCSNTLPCALPFPLYYLSLLSHHARYSAPSPYHLFPRTLHIFHRQLAFLLLYYLQIRCTAFTWSLPPLTPKYLHSQSFQAFPVTSMLKLDSPPPMPQRGNPHLPRRTTRILPLVTTSVEQQWFVVSPIARGCYVALDIGSSDGMGSSAVV